MRLGLIWTGWCDDYVLADDAFYYFTIARNVAGGLGATFDGLAPTNGFHPLYLILLVPVFTVAAPAGDPWIPIRVAQTLCAGMDVASGLVLFSTLRRLGLARGAWWAAGVWLLAPFGALVTFRALEASLAVLLVALWIDLVARIALTGWPTLRQAAGLGAIFGLAVLARTDNAPLMGAGLAVQMSLLARRRRARPGETLRVVAVVGAVAGACVLPWLLWNLARFGSPWQVSGAAKLANRGVFGALHLGRRVLADTPVLRELALMAKVPWSAVRYLAGEETRPWRVTAALATALALLAAWALARSRAVARAAHAGALEVVAAGAATYLILHVVVYGVVMRCYVPWYAGVPVFLAGSWVAAVVGERVSVSAPRAAAAAAASLTAFVALYLAFPRHYSGRPKGAERALEPIFERIARGAPGVRPIGTFNAGRFGYFAPRFGPYRVVNLDCMVNNRAYAAWRRGAYVDYLSENVDLICADPVDLGSWLDEAEIDRLVARFPAWPERGFYGPRRDPGRARGGPSP